MKCVENGEEFATTIIMYAPQQRLYSVQVNKKFRREDLLLVVAAVRQAPHNE